jgi:hypothetical protein
VMREKHSEPSADPNVSAEDQERTGSLLEVIQPHLPVRLPCYDLAPVTDLTFGRSLPCGLGHGLRAPSASMA